MKMAKKPKPTIEEKAHPVDKVAVGMGANIEVTEEAQIRGHWHLECHDEDGNLLWAEDIDNVVTNVGKNLILDSALAGSAYTVVGPFMGLISSTSFTAVSINDTMTSHAGWLEGGNANAPTCTAPRKTAAWNAASGGSKALSASLVFNMTGTGTIQGIFLVSGTGGLSTIDNTAGVLVSAGTLAAAQPVINGNTVSASYTMSL